MVTHRKKEFDTSKLKPFRATKLMHASTNKGEKEQSIEDFDLRGSVVVRQISTRGTKDVDSRNCDSVTKQRYDLMPAYHRRLL